LKDSYNTIKELSRAQLKIKRSKFIATAFPCTSRAEAEEKNEEISRQFHDANHNCFAYRLWSGSGQDIFRYSDAGEPSGTAGRPIYDTLIGHDLFNVGIIVTRYFGGVKLGTGGLARAYKDSALSVLNQAEIMEKLILDKYRIEFPHNLTSIILRILSTDGVFVGTSNYTDKGEIVFEVRLSKAEKTIETLTSKTNARIKISKEI